MQLGCQEYPETPDVRGEAQPLFFGGAGRELFGWFHPAHGPVRRNCGIVMCPPLGHEYMWSHRAYRRLAEELAAAGFSALRFDYQGTGNSSGDPRDPDQLRLWQNSIRAAIAKIREVSGGSTVSLVGLRFGATLAMIDSAEHDDLASIVLWAPCLSGASYLRELRMLQSMTNDSPAGESADSGAAGFVLTPTTALELRTINLLSIQSHVPDVLVISRDDRPPDQLLTDHLSSCGAQPVQLQPPGTAAMLVNSMTSIVPTEVLGGTIRWLSAVHPPANQPAPHHTQVAPHLLTPSHPISVDNGENRTTRVYETPMRFGKDGRLFGIITAPRSAHDGATRPAVVFLNTGADHHVGPHRMYVPLARELAARGFFTFRFDFAGLGESSVQKGNEVCVTYPSDALINIREAIALLRSTCGVQHVALVGLCSGGYFAIRAALTELPVVTCISINPPLYWKKGRLVDAAELQKYVEVGFPKGPFWRQRRMLNLLGDSTGPGHLLAASVMKAKTVARTALSATGLPILQGGVGAELRSLSDQGTDILLIFARGEWALTRLETHLGKQMRTLRGRDNLRLEIMDGADHSFQPIQAQQQLSTLLLDHISRRYGPEQNVTPGVDSAGLVS